jgi:hypothetical protein
MNTAMKSKPAPTVTGNAPRAPGAGCIWGVFPMQVVVSPYLSPFPKVLKEHLKQDELIVNPQMMGLRLSLKGKSF